MKYFIILIVLFSACSVQKKCNRHINRLDKLGCLKRDTITKYDTIKGFQYDTIVRFDTLSHSDTLVVIKDGVKVQTIIKWKNRIVEQSILKRDTIIKNQFVNDIVVETKEVMAWWVKWVFLMMLIACLLLIFRK
jgi:hypothetical protein